MLLSYNKDSTFRETNGSLLVWEQRDHALLIKSRQSICLSVIDKINLFPVPPSHALPFLFPAVNFDISKGGSSVSHSKGMLRPLKKIGFSKGSLRGFFI